jgi:hypothetical protein
VTSGCKSIAIITHARDDFDANESFLKLLIPEWERQGITTFTLRGTAEFRPADVAIMHVNLTVVPAAYRALAARFPVTINGRVDDISKSKVSTHLVRRGDGYDGPVIVKTNLNYGGRPERWLTRSASRLGRLRLKIESRLPWTWSGALDVADYQIYERTSDVPRVVWSNSRLSVQRYLPERDGSFYCLRQWLFFGDREANTLCFSEAPIIKASNVVKRERGLPVPDQLRAMRARLGFDYGKFDYGLANGEVILYDANRTPTRSRDIAVTPDVTTIGIDLAQGIHSFVPSSRCV